MKGKRPAEESVRGDPPTPSIDDMKIALYRERQARKVATGALELVSRFLAGLYHDEGCTKKECSCGLNDAKSAAQFASELWPEVLGGKVDDFDGDAGVPLLQRHGPAHRRRALRAIDVRVGPETKFGKVGLWPFLSRGGEKAALPLVFKFAPCAF